MTPEQYTYWFNGFVELNGGQMPTEAQWKSIVEHLSTVFNKVTPKYDPNQKYCRSTSNANEAWSGNVFGMNEAIFDSKLKANLYGIENSPPLDYSKTLRTC